jgi:hypothetical protein
MGGARNIYVPKIGLSDGIVKRCIMVKYNDKLASKSNPNVDRKVQYLDLFHVVCCNDPGR